MITFKEFFSENKQPLAPADYAFSWDLSTMGGNGVEDFFNMTQNIPEAGLASGSTVSRNTLVKAGFYVPSIPPNTEKGTPLTQLEDRLNEGLRADNPFKYKMPKKLTPRKVRIPKQKLKPDLPSKPKKSQLLKPRKWEVNKWGNLVKRYT